MEINKNTLKYITIISVISVITEIKKKLKRYIK